MRTKISDEQIRTFDAWLTEHVEDVPMCRWGPSQTEVAVKYAEWYAKRAVNRTLDVALNSGNGTYKP